MPPSPVPGQEGFGFDRLGVRVPMVMVSQHIAKHTIVNSQMDHSSFAQTMAQKWGLASLGPRQDAARPFTEVFAKTPRSEPWPDFRAYPASAASVMMAGDAEEGPPAPRIDAANVPLNDLQFSILNAIQQFHPDTDTLSGPMAADADDGPPMPAPLVTNAAGAQALLERVSAQGGR